MSKILRKYLAHFINTAADGEAVYERLGKDLEEFTPEMAAQVETDVVEVKLWETAEGTAYPAIREEAFIEVTSYGGDTAGYQIPFTLHFTGKKVKGTFDVTTKTFTPAE